MTRLQKLLGTMFILGLFGAIAIGLSAQTSTALAWDESAISLSAAQSYTYTLYVNGTSAGVLSPVTCSGTTTFTCSVPLSSLPQMPVGTDALTVTASSGGVESPQSVPLSNPVPPSTPANLRKK